MTTSISSSEPPDETSAAATPVLACLALTMLLSSLGTSIANVALPTFVDAFGAPFNAVQWVMLAYLLAMTVMVVSAGRLGDLFGRRRMMLGGIAVYTLASIACAVSTELWMLVLARAAQGGAAAVMMALSMALVGDVLPKARAGRAMGFLGTTSAVGTALGPSLGGVLIGAPGWPAIFLVSVPLGLLAIVLAYRFLPRDPAHGVRPGFDLIGSVLLMLTLMAYALAMTVGRVDFGTLGLALLVAAAVGARLFLAVESRCGSPLIHPSLFGNRMVATGFVMSGLVTTVAMTTLVVGPFYLSGSLMLDPTAVGMVMTTGPLVAALAGLPAGLGVDRFGAHRMTTVGLLAMTSGSVALSVVPVSFGVAGYVLSLVTITAGFAVFQAANNTAVVTGTEAGLRGVVSGLLGLSRNLGLITGASVMGAVFAASVGTAELTSAAAADIASGTHVAFAVAAVLVGSALLIAIGFARPASPRPLTD